MLKDLQSKFKVKKDRNSGLNWGSNKAKQKQNPQAFSVCLPGFRTHAMMSTRRAGDFKLIHHLQRFAGGSVNDFIGPRLCSCSCALLDYSIDMLEKDVQVRANGLSRH